MKRDDLENIATQFLCWFPMNILCKIMHSMRYIQRNYYDQYCCQIWH